MTINFGSTLNIGETEISCAIDRAGTLNSVVGRDDLDMPIIVFFSRLSV